MIPPERALFQAVIIRAIVDAKGSSASEGPSAESLAQQQARSWLSGGGRDFKMVCSLAGIEASNVRAAYLSGKLDGISLDTARASNFETVRGEPQ